MIYPGIVSLPFAMRESGYILGPILLILFGVVTNWSLRLLVHSAQLLNNSSSAMRPKYDEMPEGKPTIFPHFAS